MIGFVKKWNSLDKSLKKILNKEFPKGWESTSNKVAELSYSVLKSDGKLRTCQDVHCDSKKAFAYTKAKATTKFGFSIIVGVEDYSFLDFVNDNKGDYQLRRVCICRGDVLMLRGDIPHRGVENAADHEHYRIHVYCDPVGIKAEDKIGKDTTIPAFTHKDFSGPYVYDFGSGSWTCPYVTNVDNDSSDDENIIHDGEHVGTTPV